MKTPILITLIVSVVALAATLVLVLRYRRRERQRNKQLVRNLRERDRIMRELEESRIQQQTLEKAIETFKGKADSNTENMNE